MKNEKVKKPFYKRWWFIALAVVFVLGALASSGDDGEEIAEGESSEAERNESTETNDEEESTEPESVEDIIRNKVIEVTGDKTVRDSDKLISLDINDNAGTEVEDDKIVLVDVAGEENLSLSMTRDGILDETTKILEKLSEVEEVSEAVVSNHYPLVDEYGESTEEVVLKVGLNKETLDKINWENFRYEKLEGVADEYFEHPAMKKE